jgi:hypothetical protein
VRDRHQAVRGPGPKLLAPDEDTTTHDFLLQNHDVFFVDTAG